MSRPVSRWCSGRSVPPVGRPGYGSHGDGSSVTEPKHDVVIVGGGPAGVNAALECKDINLDVLLVETASTLGGQLIEISHSVRNVATGRYADGQALQAGLQRAAEPLGDRVRLEHPVTAAGLADGWIQAGGQRLYGQSGAHRDGHDAPAPTRCDATGRSEATSPMRWRATPTTSPDGRSWLSGAATAPLWTPCFWLLRPRR